MNFQFLSQTMLFYGTPESEIASMLPCLDAHTKTFSKGEFIMHAGQTTHSIGIVLFGSAIIEYSDVWGNASILNHVSSGQIFAETYACIPGEKLMINVIANETTDILFLDIKRLMTTCSNSCAHHTKMIENLLKISARKNLDLSRRILHTASKSIRGRLLSYFSQQILQNGAYEFSIPFNRQQLADYLGVDRSALSNELSKMKKEGILTYRKNTFSLRHPLL